MNLFVNLVLMVCHVVTRVSVRLDTCVITSLVTVSDVNLDTMEIVAARPATVAWLALLSALI